MRQVVEYAEMITLVNLGRAGEARQRSRPEAGQGARGDYLRLQHWGAELYVCLAEGEHRIDPEQLHQCAIAALKITGAAALLGLTAWAHWKRNDLDQAWHLLREAYDRRKACGSSGRCRSCGSGWRSTPPKPASRSKMPDEAARLRSARRLLSFSGGNPIQYVRVSPLTPSHAAGYAGALSRSAHEVRVTPFAAVL